MIHDQALVCECRKMPLEEYDGEIDLELMRKHVRIFICKSENARLLTFDEVKRRKTVYFEIGHTRPDELIVINLSNIMTEYKVDGQKLLAVKLWQRKNEWTVEKITFPVENYGKTWRCWSAVPTDEQIRKAVW